MKERREEKERKRRYIYARSNELFVRYKIK